MSHDLLHAGRLTLRLEYPLTHNRKPVAFVLYIDGEELRQLPMDRELPFAIESHHEARRITDRRQLLAKTLSSMLTEKLLEALKHHDTINGYTREEHDAFMGQSREDMGG